MNKALQITADASVQWSDLEAADGEEKVPQFSMVAYTGGAMHVGFHHPVIVDLAGIKASGDIPIFRQHDPTQIVGHGKAEISDGGIVASGIISADNEHSRDVVSSSRKGFPWQASIGASVERFETLKEDDTATVNGKPVKGPVLIARKSTLNEISFVPLGADRRTSAKVAASKSVDDGKGNNMKFTEWLQANDFDPELLSEKATEKLNAQFEAETNGSKAEGEGKVSAHGESFMKALEAERKEKARVESIDMIASEYMRRYPTHLDEIERLVLAAHRDKKTDERDFKLALLESCQTFGTRGVNVDKTPQGAKVVEAAICRTLRMSTIEKQFDAQTLEAADRHFRGGVGLQQLLFKAAAANGQHFDGVGNLKSLLSASFQPSNVMAQDFSTFSLSGILSNVMNKMLVDYFTSATDSSDPRVGQVWRQIAAIRPVRDFKQVTAYTLTGDLTYEQLPPTGEIKHGTVGEQSYVNKADTYAKMLAISRQDIINDDLGALQRIPQRLGRGAALAIFDAFWSEFLNNSTFFSIANDNVSSGAFSADGVALSAAEAEFLAQTDPDGNPLGVSPSILLVPPGSLNAALTLINSTVTTGGTTNIGNANVFGGRYSVLSSPYMVNSKYTGNSTTAFYLLANPMDLPTIEVVFLNGRESPIVESADVDFNTLGIQFRGYHDFGVAKQEPRGGVRGSGAT